MPLLLFRSRRTRRRGGMKLRVSCVGRQSGTVGTLHTHILILSLVFWLLLSLFALSFLFSELKLKLFLPTELSSDWEVCVSVCV